MRISSYGKIYNLGTPQLAELFSGERIIIQEKLDGSQMSFQKIGDEIVFRSRGQEFRWDEPPKLFKKAVDHILERKDRVREGVIYRGEAITSPRHNVLNYERTPDGFFVLWDVYCGNEGNYQHHSNHRGIAESLGIEFTPTYYDGHPEKYRSIEAIEKDFMSAKSILGGEIEGIVIKRPGHMIGDHPCMGKFVAGSFREKHTKGGNPKVKNFSDFDAMLMTQISLYRTDARYDKAIAHLRDQDKLQYQMQDMPLLIKELTEDFSEECKEEILEDIWKKVEKMAQKILPSKLAPYYKQYLAKRIEND